MRRKLWQRRLRYNRWPWSPKYDASDMTWTSVTEELLLGQAHDLTVSYNTAPVIVDPDHILYSGSAVVPKVPLDGIARLRKRLGRP